MDCVAVWTGKRIDVREFRRLKQGELVAVGRTEQGEEGILVHPDGFGEGIEGAVDHYVAMTRSTRELVVLS